MADTLWILPAGRTQPKAFDGWAAEFHDGDSVRGRLCRVRSAYTGRDGGTLTAHPITVASAFAGAGRVALAYLASGTELVVAVGSVERTAPAFRGQTAALLVDVQILAAVAPPEFAEAVRQCPLDCTTLGVVADWLDELDRPTPAGAFRSMMAVIGDLMAG